MGLAIITPGVSFAGTNLGKVTMTKVVDVTSFDIMTNESYIGTEALLEVGNFIPSDTSQRSVSWSVVEGGEYATIDNSGKLTILSGASNSSVSVKATSVDKPSVYATKNITVTYFKEDAGVDLTVVASNGKVWGIAGRTTDSGCTMVSNKYNNADANYAIWSNIDVKKYKMLKVTMPVTDSENDSACVYGMSFTRINNSGFNDGNYSKWGIMLKKGDAKGVYTQMIDLVALRAELGSTGTTNYCSYVQATVWSAENEELYGKCQIIGYE